jgi:hypothetical protein
MGIIVPAGNLLAQEILPGITVKDFNGKIIISWRNEYPFKVKTINVQRSFDSSKNFSTIGSVINPQKLENGFVDEKPPYDKMFYRVFIFFDGGEYIFSESVTPVKELSPPPAIVTHAQVTQEIPDDPFNKADAIKHQGKDKKKEPDSKPVVPAETTEISAVSKKNGKQKTKTEEETKTAVPADKTETLPVSKKSNKKKSKTKVDPKPEAHKVKAETPVVSKNNNKEKPSVQPKTEEVAVAVPKEEVSNYPSRRIYTAKDNNIIINLPDFETHKYAVKFFDEDNKPLFELNRIKEGYLIIEKMNFLRAGWFYFEIYDNGKLIEKNKFFIPKDGKVQ